MTVNTLIQKLFAGGDLLHFKNGEVIVNAYEKPEGIYLIKEGFVKSYSITENGETNIQLLRTKGDIFPLLWGLGNIERDVFFAAMSKVTLLKVSTAEFQKHIESNQDLLKEMNERLVEVYLLLAERVRNLEQRRAKQRLLYCLNSLAERFGKLHKDYVLIEAPVHHHDLADMINTSRETTSREFANLEEERLVGYKGSKIVLYTGNN